MASSEKFSLPLAEHQPIMAHRRRTSVRKALLVSVLTAFLVWTYGSAFLTNAADFLQLRRPCHGSFHRQHPHAGGSSIEGFLASISHRQGQASSLGLSDLERHLEQKLLDVPSPEAARAASQRYSNVTHVAGTKADFEQALMIQQEWAALLGAPTTDDPKSLLFDAGSSESIHYLTGDWSKVEPGNPLGSPRVWTDTYHVWLNYVVNTSLSLAPKDDPKNPTFVANLEEDVIPEDPTSAHGNRPFHGYSKSGSATGPIVYAGLCSREDFIALEEQGVNVKGAITLCRYGGPFRGLKVRASAIAGAAGCLLYSDPLEDGVITEANGYKAYPDGPARHPSSVQRGSVQALSFYPGDPGTPGKPSYKNATRLDPETADSLPKIPSLPISYANAKPLLEALKGHGINTAKLEHDQTKWVGQVPGVDEYWTGPSEAVVSMTNNMTDIGKPLPLWNSYALIPGFLQDEVVITAVHRDAWGFGTADPISGTASMHEAVAGLGALLKTGWRPLRSILIASWDGEEYGLVGSTEFGEDYAKWLQEKAVVYLNTDVAAAGSNLKIEASPSLARLFREAGKEILDPLDKSGTNATLNITKVGPLGSGSDFSVFLQHLGIASSNAGYAYAPGSEDPVYHYHSNYDSLYAMDKFEDPGYHRHAAMGKLLGLTALRSAQSIFVPLDIVEYSSTLAEYIARVESKAKEVGSDLTGLRGGDHHPLSFDSLRHGQHQLEKTAQKIVERQAQLEAELKEVLRHERDHHDPHHSHRPSRKIRHLLRQIRRINEALRTFEQHFISPEGLKDRPWYRSLLVGPGRWRGYGATPLPGLTEAITLDQDVKAAKWELKRLEKSLKKATKSLEGALDGRHGHHGHHHHHKGKKRAGWQRAFRRFVLDLHAKASRWI